MFHLYGIAALRVALVVRMNIDMFPALRLGLVSGNKDSGSIVEMQGYRDGGDVWDESMRACGTAREPLPMLEWRLNIQP